MHKSIFRQGRRGLVIQLQVGAKWMKTRQLHYFCGSLTLMSYVWSFSGKIMMNR